MAKTSFPTALGITALIALVGAFQAHAQSQNGSYGSQKPNTSGSPKLGKGELEEVLSIFQRLDQCVEDVRRNTNQNKRSSKACAENPAACRAPQSPPNAEVGNAPRLTTEKDCHTYWETQLDEWSKKTAESKKR